MLLLTAHMLLLIAHRSPLTAHMLAYLPCKHLYYLYVQVCKLEADHDLFMHAPTLSFLEVKTILERGILAHATV